MDSVPYEFIDNVLTKLSHESIITICVKSPPWQEAVAYRNKLRCHTFHLFAEPDAICLKISNLKDEQEVPPTFDEFLRMDPRFHRVANLVLHSYEYHTSERLPHSRLPALLQVLSQFTLQTCQAQAQPYLMALVARHLPQHSLRVEELTVGYAPGNVEFLKVQLLSDELRGLVLYGGWPTEQQFRARLKTFICRANFKYLDCQHCDYDDIFDIEEIKAIVAFWNSAELPWESAYITIRSIFALNHAIATWLTPPGSRLGPQFVQRNGQYAVVFKRLRGFATAGLYRIEFCTCDSLDSENVNECLLNPSAFL